VACLLTSGYATSCHNLYLEIEKTVRARIDHTPLQNRFFAVLSAPEQALRRFLRSRTGFTPFSSLQNRSAAVFSTSDEFFPPFFHLQIRLRPFSPSRTGLPSFSPIQNRLWPFSPLQNRFSAVFSSPDQVAAVFSAPGQFCLRFLCSRTDLPPFSHL
jgi:hypothetical protein